MHVSPAHGTADPPGLLDLKLRNFGVPPDDCLESAMTNGITRGPAASYTPELGTFLWQQQQVWDRRHGNAPRGTIGSILGDCYPSSRPGSPMYHNVTLRKALNIMATRSLQVARGEARSNGPYTSNPKLSPGSIASVAILQATPVLAEFRFFRTF